MSEWKTINLPYGPVYNGIKTQNSFVKLGLNKPGTLIELKDGSRFLIGDINVNKGVCDDCVEFDSKTIVKRYKVVFDLRAETGSNSR